MKREKHMKYKQEIEKMMKEDYKAFCKALLCIESGAEAEDEDKLNALYDNFMNNDDIGLLDRKIFDNGALI